MNPRHWTLSYSLCWSLVLFDLLVIVLWFFLLGIRRYVAYFLFYIEIFRYAFHVLYTSLFLHSLGSHSLSLRLLRLISLYNFFLNFFSHNTKTLLNCHLPFIYYIRGEILQPHICVLLFNILVSMCLYSRCVNVRV